MCVHEIKYSLESVSFCLFFHTFLYYYYPDDILLLKEVHTGVTVIVTCNIMMKSGIITLRTVNSRTVANKVWYCHTLV